MKKVDEYLKPNMIKPWRTHCKEKFSPQVMGKMGSKRFLTSLISIRKMKEKESGRGRNGKKGKRKRSEIDKGMRRAKMIRERTVDVFQILFSKSYAINKSTCGGWVLSTFLVSFKS